MESPGILQHGRTLRRDLRDVYHFYLSEHERESLASMSRIKRFFRIGWWLARNMARRLSRTRRLLLVVATVLFFLRPGIQWEDARFDLDFSRLAFPLVVLVLALELKDKLLARDEIEVARQVQLSLLPKSRPHVPGWEMASATIPANDVGGDLIDYLDGAGGRQGVALGDVSGKGMGAALLCAKLQATLRALAPQAESLESLGASLNGVLERSGLDNRYATLFYAEIGPGDGEIRYLNAGHNPPLVVSTSRTEPLPASSLPLGMLPGIVYGRGLAQVEAGDLLVLYSDGITEATDAAGVEYGLARLEGAIREVRHLPVEALVEAVLEDVARFRDGEKPQDDQSLLVLRRTAR